MQTASKKFSAKELAIICSMVCILTACQKEKVAQVERAPRAHETKIQTTLQLPNDDGRVYVIESPADDFGFEINTCMLHVKGATSSFSCAQPRMKVIDTEQR